MRSKDDFTRAGDVLKTLFDRIVPEEASLYSGFFSGWENIVGVETSMHVIPRDIINGSLLLEADHPGWSQRIRLQQSEILSKIRFKYPELNIKRIKISIGNASPQTPREEKKVVEADIVQKKEEATKKTPSIVVERQGSEEDGEFFKILEEMRRRGKS